MARKSGRGILSVAGSAALLAVATAVYADSPVTMAPPVNADDAYSYSDGPTNASADSVFQWDELPQSQRVPLTRAIFDRSGYQLYDTQGETILVPFSNNNLYVMKFAETSGDEIYFVNEGGVPVLYVPRGAYLENATVPGAKWYPFSEKFHPTTAVFLGIAPSWDDYCSMGWYPDMVCYGGYYSRDPYWGNGSNFFASINLTFIFGGHRYHGWEPYHNYYSYHRAPYVIRDYGHHWDRPYRGGGYGHGWGGDRVFRGGGHEYRVNRGGGDHGFRGGDRGPGGVHVYRGGDRGDNNVHVFRGAGNRPGWDGNHNNTGGRPGWNGDHNSGDRPGRGDGGNHNDGGGHVFDGGSRGDGGGRVFHGGDRGGVDGGGRVFGGGDIGGKHPFPSSADGGRVSHTGGDNGGGRVYTGNTGDGGGRVFHGGGDSGGGGRSHGDGGGGGGRSHGDGGGGGGRSHGDGGGERSGGSDRSGGGGGRVESHSDNGGGGGNRGGGGGPFGRR